MTEYTDPNSYVDSTENNNNNNSGNHKDNGDGTGILTDTRDSQQYKTVKIGDQWWMAENLNYGTMVNYGYQIHSNGIAEKYCYNDCEDSCAIYGAYYDWNEANYFDVDGHDICPNGWHIPSEAEWNILETYIGLPGGELNYINGRGTIEGGKLKTVGERYWYPPNTAASNEYGFSAIGAGLYYGGSGVGLNTFAYFWTSTNIQTVRAWCRYLFFEDGQIYRKDWPQMNGLSVRCIMD